MSLELTSFEFNLLYVLTILLLVTKTVLSFYLLRRILKDKKKTGHFSFNFNFGFFIMMICLFFSRLLYFHFDFNLTRFDYSKYHMYPNYVFWKIASIISLFGLAIFVFIIDKQAFDFKLKGILACLLLASTFFIALYPINTSEDFKFVSYIFLLVSLVGAIIPFLFIYIGIKKPPLRKYAFIISLGVIIFLISVNLVTEAMLTPLREIFGPGVQVVMFCLYLILKIIGLSLCAYGVIHLI